MKRKKTIKYEIVLPRSPFVFASLGLAAASGPDELRSTSLMNLFNYIYGKPLEVELPKKKRRKKS
jgi:hypothetical protein